jgi:hypothetical protein
MPLSQVDALVVRLKARARQWGLLLSPASLAAGAGLVYWWFSSTQQWQH